MDFEFGVVEISQYGFVVCHVHGMIVVRILPFVVFILMAVHAFFAAGKGGRRRCAYSVCVRSDGGHFLKVERNGENNDDGCDKTCDFPSLHGYAFLAYTTCSE